MQKVLFYAVDCHSGQFRQSGEPYIGLTRDSSGRDSAKLKLDAVTVACGFLHDVKYGRDLDDLEREFGQQMCAHRRCGDPSSSTSPTKKGWRKTIARCHALSQDIRVNLVKLRSLYNMRNAICA